MLIFFFWMLASRFRDLASVQGTGRGDSLPFRTVAKTQAVGGCTPRLQAKFIIDAAETLSL